MASQFAGCKVDIDHQVGFNQNTNLCNACFEGNEEQVKFLLELGVDINRKNLNGDTAFNKACEQGHIEIAKLLLEKGYDVNMRLIFLSSALLPSLLLSPLTPIPSHPIPSHSIPVNDPLFFITPQHRASSLAQFFFHTQPTTNNV